MLKVNRLLSASLVLVLILSVTVSPVIASNLKPMTEDEMSNVRGKSDVAEVMAKAQSIEQLDAVFEEMEARTSSERLLEEKKLTGLAGVPFSRTFTGSLAEGALENPQEAVAIATSAPVREMTRIAAKSASIFKGLFANIPGQR